MDTETPSESGFRQTNSDYGPQTEQVADLVDRLGRLTVDEAESIAAAWEDATETAWVAADLAQRGIAHRIRETTLRKAEAATIIAVDRARDRGGRTAPEVWDAVTLAAVTAVWGLVVSDLTRPETYRAMTSPIEDVLGPLHPDDPEVTA